MPIQLITQSELDQTDPLLQFDHPKFVLDKLTKRMKKVGVQAFLRGPGHGDDRDLFIGSLFSFYPRRVQAREWFIQKPEQFPDLELASFSNRSLLDKPCDVLHVEITTIIESIPTFEAALESLKTHKLSKLYQEDKQLALLIFINNRNAPKWAREFCKFFGSSKDRFGQVFAIYLLDQNQEDIYVYEVDSLRPVGSTEVFKLSEELKREMLPNPFHDRFARKISPPSK